MDIHDIAEKFLNNLYLKTKKDFQNAIDSDTISKMLNFDTSQSNNVISYLEEKGLIVTHKPFGNEVKLSANGIDEILRIRKGKEFATIKFQQYRYLPSSRDAIEYLFNYDIINERDEIRKEVKISVSGTLAMYWGYRIWTNDARTDYNTSLPAILIYYGKDRIIEKLKEQTLNDYEEIMFLSSDNLPKYNHDKIIEFGETEFEVQVGQNKLSDEIKENRLAASIIETRDIINSIFYQEFSERLLLLNEERNLLDFFKTAKTEEEYSHRLSSLGQVSRHLNVSILRKMAEEKDTTIGSVTLLSGFLNKIGKKDNTIIDCLKNLGRIRQGYPIHTDIAGVIKSYQFFKIKYPIDNYGECWTTLLNNYLSALKELKDILADEYLK